MKALFLHIIFLAFLVFFSTETNAQTSIDFSPENVERRLLTANGGVNILQIGVFNETIITKDKYSEVGVLQKGSNNQLYVDGLLTKGHLNVQQFGTDNNISSYGKNSIMDNATIIQNGYQLKLMITNF